MQNPHSRGSFIGSQAVSTPAAHPVLNRALAAEQTRSKAARRVNAVLADMVHRETLKEVQFGRIRVGRVVHRIRWHHDRMYRFALDLDAQAVALSSFLPARLPPQLLRDLQSFLRVPAAHSVIGHGDVRVFARHGALTLAIVVNGDAYEHCTEQLVSLGDRILRELLDRPPYRQYRVERLCWGLSG